MTIQEFLSLFFVWLCGVMLGVQITAYRVEQKARELTHVLHIRIAHLSDKFATALQERGII